MTLETIFADTIARPWAPRSPAVGEQLGRCLVSKARGDCIAPLVLDGDELYLDPVTKAQDGDLVSFRLSERGAAAQNAALPPGQSPARAGDRWVKLYTTYHGFPMLLDRHKSSATATLMSCESPDDVPMLAPVRNIRRRGRLLYTADSLASQIGANAVNSMWSVQDDSLNSVGFAGALLTYAGSGPAVPYVASPVLSFQSPVSGPCIFTITTQVYLTNNAAGSQVPAAYCLAVVLDVTSLGNVVVDYFPKSGTAHSFNNVGEVSASPAQTNPQTFGCSATENLTQFHTYKCYLLCQTDSSHVTANFYSTEIRAQLVKR